MSEPLEIPRAIEELYMARASEVSVLRPIMTGDVFKEVDISGVGPEVGDELRIAMLISHPCSMRDGFTMKATVQAVRVLKFQPIEIPAWKHNFDVMPLPNLLQVAEDDDLVDPEDSFAAMLDLRGRVPTKSLLLQNRIACLSEEGIGFLQQRMSHHDTRYAPRVSDLMASCAGPLAEAELAEEWNQKLLNIDGLDTAKRDDVLLAAAQDFDQVLSELREKPVPGKKPAQYRLRTDLGIPKKVPLARREIMKIIRQRSSERSDG